jgi:hypothetical protein
VHRENRACLSPRQAAFVGAYAPVERTESLGDDDVVLVAVKYSRNGCRLRFRHRGDFFNHHALSFALGASAAGGQANHPQRHDALRIDAKLRSLQRDLEPWVEQRTPFAGEKREADESRQISAPEDLGNLFFARRLAQAVSRIRGKGPSTGKLAGKLEALDFWFEA